ncbi:MAG: hydrogenase expression/formation protein HypE [Alphaproteobacteria bacterium]
MAKPAMTMPQDDGKDRITLAHGNGGRFMRELIEEVIAPPLAGLDLSVDAAALALEGELLVTTDGFTVQPLEFPGGDIGRLAVHGTVNDLAVAGAEPRALTLGMMIEEGMDVETLRRLMAGLAEAAQESGVRVLAGDTKVVPRGHGGGLYLTTTGVGVRRSKTRPELARVKPGSVLLVSGPVGDHGIAVMLAREEFDLHGDISSDCASVLPLTAALWEEEDVLFLRDPTRGGLATVAHEIAHAAGAQVRLLEAQVPVRETVTGVCEILGYDPYYLACEGRVVAVTAPEAAERVLEAWRALPQGREAAIIGRVEEGRPRVVCETEIGGERMIEELEDDPLPRIC